MTKKFRGRNLKIIYLFSYLCFLITFLFFSATMSEILGISDRQALLVVLLFIFAAPFLLVLALLLGIILSEILIRGAKIFTKQTIVVFTSNDKQIIYILYGHQFLKITHLLFSEKTQREIFQAIVGDWDEEVFLAFKKKEREKIFMINIRNTYRFFLAMWQKSPIGDLIEFVTKIAKQ